METNISTKKQKDILKDAINTGIKEFLDKNKNSSSHAELFFGILRKTSEQIVYVVNNNYKKLASLLEGLDSDKKDILIDFFEYLNNDQLGVMFEEAEKDSRFLDFLSQNIKAKREILSTKDKARWKDIISEEENFLGK